LSTIVAIRRAVVWAILLPLRAYSRFVSPLLPRRCRYEPTCSAYAEDAIRELGPLRGIPLAAWRVLRCNPLSRGGYDPVSARPFFRSRDGHVHRSGGSPA
jgi:putative membrane protein insertion efficiency factor